MGWAGPAQPTGPDSAQKCWADFGPKNNILIWARPGPEGRSGPDPAQKAGLGRTRPGPDQNGWGELISPHPCMQNAIRSACREGKKQMNTRIRGKKSYLARRRRWLAAFLAVLWWRLVAAPWLTDGGSKQRQRCSVFFSVFP